MKRSNSLALVLLAAAVVVTQASYLVDIHRSGTQLEEALASQTKLLQGNKRAEAQLEALAKGVNQLARGGNANARRIVETLKQNGISIKD